MLLIPIADLSKNFTLFFVAWVTLIAMGSYRSPAVALMPDLTQRSYAVRNAVINLMGAVGEFLLWP